MKRRRLTPGNLAHGFLYAFLIIIPLCVPLFILSLVLDGESLVPDGNDHKVVIGQNAVDGEYNRFTPRKVFHIGLHIEDLGAIDLGERSFFSRMTYWARNHFDRSPNDRGRLDTEELRIVNSSGLETAVHSVRPVADQDSPEPGADDPAPAITYVSHTADGTLRNDYWLRRFPFDEQTLKITFEPRSLTAEDILLAVDPASTLSGAIDLGEWRIVSFKGDASVRVAKSDFSDPVLINRGALFNYVPRVQFTITVARRIISHLLKDLLPLLVIMLMVYCSFFVAPKWFDARSSVAITGLLAVVALHWSARSDLPGVAYITSMDEFFLVSYVLMLLALVESVISMRLSPEEDAELPADYVPHSWIRIGLPLLRVLYPLVLAAGWYAVVLRALG